MKFLAFILFFAFTSNTFANLCSNADAQDPRWNQHLSITTDALHILEQTEGPELIAFDLTFLHEDDFRIFVKQILTREFQDILIHAFNLQTTTLTISGTREILTNLMTERFVGMFQGLAQVDLSKEIDESEIPDISIYQIYYNGGPPELEAIRQILHKNGGNVRSDPNDPNRLICMLPRATVRIVAEIKSVLSLARQPFKLARAQNFIFPIYSPLELADRSFFTNASPWQTFDLHVSMSPAIYRAFFTFLTSFVAAGQLDMVSRFPAGQAGINGLITIKTGGQALNEIAGWRYSGTSVTNKPLLYQEKIQMILPRESLASQVINRWSDNLHARLMRAPFEPTGAQLFVEANPSRLSEIANHILEMGIQTGRQDSNNQSLEIFGTREEIASVFIEFPEVKRAELL